MNTDSFKRMMAEKEEANSSKTGAFGDVFDRWLPGGSLADDIIGIRFSHRVKKSSQDRVIREAGGLPLKHRIQISDDNYFLIRSAAELSKNSNTGWSLNALQVLSKAKGVLRVSPVFKYGCGYAVTTDKLIVRTMEPVRNYFHEFKKKGGKLIKRRKNAGVLSLRPRDDPLERVGILSEIEWIEDVMPYFVLVRMQSASNSTRNIVSPRWPDENIPWNYSLRLTKAYDVWEKEYGGIPDIRIAIIDSGVDTDHADLSDSIIDRYDATDLDSYQEPECGVHHGTAVAGLAAGMSKDDIGIRGIAGGCSLVPIKIGSIAPYGIDESYFALHIDWAVRLAWNDFHSDVICLSFELLLYSRSLEENINDALTYGRNGKGCVVVAAAGNHGGSVSFPANLPDVLAVSATNQFDEFKTWDIQDGKIKWASSFGQEIDVAAPGVALPSTANTMQDFQHQRSYSLFSGTSFAAPQVAGLAALILSVNSSLTGEQVRDIIKMSADKIGPLPYDENGRNDFFGYGRINIANALS